MTFRINATGNQYGCIEHLAALADFLILCIQDDIAILTQIPVTPGFEKLIELCCSP